MTFSGVVTRTVSTPNQGARVGGAKPTYIVHHHEAGTSFEAVIESWRTGRKQGSCHVTISNEGEAVGIVKEELRAWSLSSESFDSIALTTEIENESSGGSWPVSSAAHVKAAQLTADWCRRYNIPCDRDHVIGHREVYTRHHKGYATACPGGLDLDWIVQHANEILAGGGFTAPPKSSSPASSAPSKASAGWEWVRPSAQVQKDIQYMLQKRGRYNGLVDGDWGPLSIKGIQTTIKNVGYTGDIDGVPGPNTCKYVQVYAEKFGDYKGGVDSKLGPNSWAGFLLGLIRP